MAIIPIKYTANSRSVCTDGICGKYSSIRKALWSHSILPMMCLNVFFSSSESGKHINCSLLLSDFDVAVRYLGVHGMFAGGFSEYDMLT